MFSANADVAPAASEIFAIFADVSLNFWSPLPTLSKSSGPISAFSSILLNFSVNIKAPGTPVATAPDAALVSPASTATGVAPPEPPEVAATTPAISSLRSSTSKPPPISEPFLYFLISSSSVMPANSGYTNVQSTSS